MARTSRYPWTLYWFTVLGAAAATLALALGGAWVASRFESDVAYAVYLVLFLAGGFGIGKLTGRYPCPGCGKRFTGGDSIVSAGRPWHRKCVHCGLCRGH